MIKRSPYSSQMEFICTNVSTLIPGVRLALAILSRGVCHSLINLSLPIISALSLSSLYTAGIIREAFTTYQALSRIISFNSRNSPTNCIVIVPILQRRKLRPKSGKVGAPLEQSTQWVANMPLRTVGPQSVSIETKSKYAETSTAICHCRHL